ncbi:NDP-hexose 2,3-dehydratase [Carbonactinospora thermoautotrophica]|uniref:NDP-hexose 2,3-dehydratase n=1 Tax=Carbonactinospora thermoautotrophica TaxID=1469144 RepID=A0A132NEP7_9ACTN|nr:NDP-hexose 2,3-dehydratase family protein [Carbonactinospora thermoautotrophica]KWX05220.1 NDP-hexose 2,3-dehydratase [Carbonactinospora thermoautotrophica]KWX08613.1 NDP-hexose 2,3-dehydratase [Carbonactinospora thermoautotrophica]
MTRFPEPEIRSRLTASAQRTSSRVTPDFPGWLAERLRSNTFEVTRIPFANLDGWGFDPDTGNLVHSSGRFFSVEGVAVQRDVGPVPTWSQPILNQPDIAILGILTREIDGVLHFLMQAKPEPGNINALQISPTVQATSSNYTRVHRGGATPYVEYFTDPGRGRTVVDVLQSEQGSWFLHKRNRNMVVEVDEDVPVRGNFCWLTLGQIHRLLHVPNLVNMDTRTVLSCLPLAEPASLRPAPNVVDEGFRDALRRSVALVDEGPYGTLTGVLSWIADRKSQHRIVVRRIPLREVANWRRSPSEIYHQDGRYFSIVAVSVTASHREVRSWTQPLLAPRATGVVAFLARQIGGVAHLLVRADVRPGYLDGVELGPTVQCTPENYEGLPESHRPAFLDLVQSGRCRAHYDVVQSEEGGRFYHARNRYLVVEVGEDFPETVPPDYRWLTVGQLMVLVRHSHYLNIEARTLLACLHALW